MLPTGTIRAERTNTTGKFDSIKDITNNKGMDWLHTAKRNRDAGCQLATNRRKDLAWERWKNFTGDIGLQDQLIQELTALQQQLILQAFAAFIQRDRRRGQSRALVLASMVWTTLHRVNEAFALHGRENPMKLDDGA